MQTFEMNITDVFGNVKKAAVSVGKGRIYLLFNFSEKWRRRFYGMDVEALLALHTID